MKISSISNDGMDSMIKSCHEHESLFTRIRHALRTLFMMHDKTMVAIVLSEAGDVEGAKALLGKHDK